MEDINNALEYIILALVLMAKAVNYDPVELFYCGFSQIYFNCGYIASQFFLR